MARGSRVTRGRVPSTCKACRLPLYRQRLATACSQARVHAWGLCQWCLGVSRSPMPRRICTGSERHRYARTRA